MLHEFITLPQSSEPGADLADAAMGLRALRDLQSKVAYTGLPSEPLTAAGNQQISELVTLSERALETASKLNGVANREAGRVRQRSETVLEALRGNGFRAHVERIEVVLRSVLQYLHDAAPNFVQEWQQHLSRLRAVGYMSDSSPEIRVLEDFLIGLDEEAPTQPVQLLQWCLQAPVQTIANVTPALESGEALLGKLAEYVSAYLGKYSGGGAGSLENIQQTGKRLSEVASVVRSRMRSDHE